MANPGTLDPAALAALGSQVRGTLLTPQDPDYDARRALWHAMIDRRPGAILRCRGAADVIAGVNFARTTMPRPPSKAAATSSSTRDPTSTRVQSPGRSTRHRR